MMLAAAGLCLLLPSAFQGRDENVKPPLVRTFLSPSGKFRLEVRAKDEWRTAAAEAELFRLDPAKAGQSSIWRITLPHRQGPGRALVNDLGQVALLDEWFRAAGDYAVVVIDGKGAVRRSHSFHDAARISQIAPDRLITTAKVGPWMSAEPVLDPAGATATLQAAGRPLRLHMATGILEAR